MSAGDLSKAADRYGPLENRISVVATSGTGSAAFDLAGTGEVLDGLDYVQSKKYRWVSVICDVGIYYKFSSLSTATVDETATSGATRCFFLPANTEKDMLICGRYFVHKGLASGKIRIAISQP